MSSGRSPFRRRIFLKGNLDLRDSLIALRVHDEVRWNGINEITRSRSPACTVLVRHEPSTGSASTLAATGAVPDAVAEHNLPLGPFSAAMQFSNAVFDVTDAAIIFSTQADVTIPLVRHNTQGFLLHPYNWMAWADEDRRWLKANFTPLPLPDPVVAMEGLGNIIGRIRQKSDQPVLVFGQSAYVPGDTVHCYQGLPDTHATRIRRFNLALTDLASQCDISIIDIDRIVAEHGAHTLKLDAIHLSAEGCRFAALEVVRVLDDLGWMPAHGTLESQPGLP